MSDGGWRLGGLIGSLHRLIRICDRCGGPGLEPGQYDIPASQQERYKPCTKCKGKGELI